MKYNFLPQFQMDAAPENDGFTPKQKDELGGAIKDLQTALETKNKTIVEDMLRKHSETINEAQGKFEKWMTTKDENDVKNQKALDEVFMKFKNLQDAAGANKIEAKSLQRAIHDALQEKENLEGLGRVTQGHKFKMILKGPIDLSAPPTDMYDINTEHKGAPGFSTKAVGDMTQANILTGQGQVSYNQRQAILPSQKVNARDLVNTVRSETGIYVTYKETAGQGSISRQTEGSAKTQIDFRFSRVETITDYVSGWTKISKQLMKNLPFITTTLPRLLQREFFKVENRLFYDIMATAYAAGGTVANSGSDTDDLLQAMDWVTQLFDADYNASFGLLRYTALNRINQSILTKGYYPGAGGITSGPAGNIMINGTPIYPVTWVPSYDKLLVFDQDYAERVEVESLAIEFFEQDSDNVEKNLITARIECFEMFNEMLPPSVLIGDFGNQALS